MKKDYIYQDKGQYKLLQNATRIGGFYAGDQGIVPSERVLPEQRFAHQPIFRRPPEELVATTYYLQYRDFVIATEDTGKKFNGDSLSPVLKVKGLVAYQEPTPEAKTLADKFVQGDVWDNPGYFTQVELVILATYYLNDIGFVWLPLPQPNPSIAQPRFFKKRGFYVHQTAIEVDYILAIWSGEQVGKLALKNVHEVIPWQNHWIQGIYFLYQDGDTFGMVVYKGAQGWYYIYTANSIDGPWTQTGVYENDPTAPQSFLALLQQKDCRRLLRTVGVYNPNIDPSITFPLFIPGVTMGKTGELVGLWVVTPVSFSDRPSYVCRMTKKSGGIELEQLTVKLKFRNGQIKSFPGINSDW